jgi:hypothetical protein
MFRGCRTPIAVLRPDVINVQAIQTARKQHERGAEEIRQLAG